MDDDKSIAAKLTGVISKAADTVKHAVSHVVESASEAAQHSMEANAQKISRIPPARSVAGRLAATTNEQVYIPEASDAAAMPLPLVPAAPVAKKRMSRARPAPAKKTSAKSGAVKAVKKKTSAKKAAGKAVNRASRKASARKSAKSAGKSRARPSATARRRRGK
jgi:hypothetical protein